MGAAKTATAATAGTSNPRWWQQVMQLDSVAVDSTTSNKNQDQAQDSGNREDGNEAVKHSGAGVQINGTSKRKRPEEIIAMLQQDINQPRDGDGGEAPSEKGRSTARAGGKRGREGGVVCLYMYSYVYA